MTQWPQTPMGNCEIFYYDILFLIRYCHETNFKTRRAKYQNLHPAYRVIGFKQLELLYHLQANNGPGTKRKDKRVIMGGDMP